MPESQNPLVDPWPDSRLAVLPMRQRLFTFLLRRRFAVAYLILVVSVLSFLPSIGQWAQGDVSHYQNVSGDLLAGKLPYRDSVVEYPPYAIPFFLLPRVFGGNDYVMMFTLTMLIGDWLIKASLSVLGFRNLKTLRCLLPVLVYSLTVPAIHFFYLQRYDIWPALICVAAIWLFDSKRYALSGLMIAVGAGVKLYPAVFVPPLFMLALRQRKGTRFCAGLFLGILPIVLLSFFLPWWRFAEFQGARGLQVESLYASILWLGKLAHFLQLEWAWTKAWFEIKGPAVDVILPWARASFAIAVIGSTAFVSWAAVRLPVDLGARKGEGTSVTSIPLLARLLLIPLLAFVAFNQVLSPQYMIWLLPLAAIASLEGSFWPVVMIPLATVLTPIFFPTGDYATGLNLVETGILLLRNIMLVVAWVLIIVEIFKKTTGSQTSFFRLPSFRNDAPGVNKRS